MPKRNKYKSFLLSTFYFLLSRPRSTRGQAMILATLVLGGTILGATTIAGLLMTYQIRQTTDLTSSAKAIFAADAGRECGLYNFLKTPTCPTTLTFANGAAYDVATDLATQTILSKGIAGNVQRAFLVILQNVAAIFP